MSENKTGKYFKYAIGEIVLVVIGILIALQINTWNENRLGRLAEKSVMNNIHNEFVQNKEALKDVLDINQESYASGLEIMNLIGEKREVLERINLDSIIFQTLDFDLFSPSENALSDLIQSGRLQLLRNEELKHLLHNWSRYLYTANDNFEGFDSKIEVDLVPYLTNTYPLKDVDYYGPLKWSTKSKLKIEKYLIFEDIRYENLMDDVLYRLLTYMNNLKTLDKTIDDILIETAKNSDD